MRRLSVLEKIGATSSRTLDQTQLRDYLKDTVNVPDYHVVTESFDPAFATEAVTFDKPTTLLRLYGGTSNAIGRYFFCCLWPSATDSDQHPETRGAGRWSDATGLATPPENLRTHLAAVEIPAGTIALVGTVADNFLDQLGLVKRGGNTQIFIPHVESFPFQEYRRAGDGGAVFEIAVQSEDRILRFRQ